MTKFLFKANNEVLSHCTCENEPAMSTGQFDCPWCGCGWLISCSKCTKAFTFAEIREIDISLEELGRKEVDRRGIPDVSEEEVKQWAIGMAEILEPFESGDIVVYLDGYYWNINAENIQFKGYFSSHNFDRLPHAEALKDPAILKKILGKTDYWTDRELPNRE